MLINKYERMLEWIYKWLFYIFEDSYFEQLFALIYCGNSLGFVFSKVQRSVGEYLSNVYKT